MPRSSEGFRFRPPGWTALAVIAVLASGAACSGADGADEEPGSAPEAGDSAQASEPPQADEESLQAFAEDYVEALNGEDQGAADGMACGGESTLHSIFSGPDRTWELTSVHFDTEGSSSAVMTGPGGTESGFTARFEDGEWCSEQ
ncbi:hypothetical protein [Nocardiopsis potens]|uniref:hypothetical protein n=1 Tax=Nocardiopsis potens TaxID=1246458 RepID=UPI000349F8D1|nr:hypothetical protein [Nocardiopsis potens]